MLCKELLSVSSCAKPEPKDRCVHSRRNVDSSFEFKMWSKGVVIPTSLYKQREECGRRAYALTTKSHGQVGKRKNHLDDYFTSYREILTKYLNGFSISIFGTSKKPKICIADIPKDQPPPYFLLFNLINVTPSLPYLSFSPGLSSSTISCAKCFLSMAKNRLSAFLRFFQQKRISMSLPTGAKSQRVWTSNGNAGYNQQR